MFNVEEVLSKLTLEEKASLCSGKGFWYTKNIDRLNLPQIAMNDGPHGLRKPEDVSGSLGQSIPSTCFPTYGALGNSWDPKLLYAVGEAIADEALSNDVSILLGPGINIKRSPLCGRNFEYFSEDPYLSGEMGASFIDGVQSKGVGTSLKHFAVNNQESRRMLIDAIVDERALREIYLAGFEKAVKKSKPWTVMAAYNKLNGTYCAENTRLISGILRDEWGFDGIVVTDWGACNDRVEGLKAGLDLQMPEHIDNDKKLAEAVKRGDISLEALDKVVLRILTTIQKSLQNRKENYGFDAEKHHQLARKACAESAVLLKNDGILPLPQNSTIAVIGELAQIPHFQGGGSSRINPLRIDTPLEAFKQSDIVYAKGYDIKKGRTTKELLREAEQVSKNADFAIVFAGYTDAIESEGIDKKNMDIPGYMNEVISAAYKANTNTIVVLFNGSAISMPWINEVKGVLECCLPGQASGEAVYEIIMGRVNPSGKLAETFPIKLSDNPAYEWFPGGPGTVEYRESIYVGYRYYDTAGVTPLFPFGFGLSYTTFEYGDLKLSSEKINENEELKVEIEVKNTGGKSGAEVVQLYVTDEQSTVFKPAKELKAFEKIWLRPGEKRKVEFILDKRSFAYYNTKINDWHVEEGIFVISVGSSSAEIHSKASVFVQAECLSMPDYEKTAPDYYDISSRPLSIADESFGAVLNRDIPPNKTDVKRPFDQNSTLIDLRQVFIGRVLHRLFIFITKRMSSSEFESSEVMVTQAEELPLRGIGALSGMVSPAQIGGILIMVNGRFIKGLIKVIRNK